MTFSKLLLNECLLMIITFFTDSGDGVRERVTLKEIKLFSPCSPQSGDDSSEEEEGEVDSEVEFPRRQR